MTELERRIGAAGIGRPCLDTADNQPEAIAFYEALGYRRTGTDHRHGWSWTLIFFEKVVLGESNPSSARA